MLGSLLSSCSRCATPVEYMARMNLLGIPSSRLCSLVAAAGGAAGVDVAVCGCELLV